MRIFISYSRDKRESVEAIARVLEDGGHDPWYDKELTPGKDWKRELAVEIRRADVFIYALTPKSVTSSFCQWEFQRARQLRKPVLPVLLALHDDDFQLPPELAQIQYVDFQDGPTATNTARLLKGLKQERAVPILSRWLIATAGVIVALVVGIALGALQLLPPPDPPQASPTPPGPVLLSAVIAAADLGACAAPRSFLEALPDAVTTLDQVTLTRDPDADGVNPNVLVSGECQGDLLLLRVTFPIPFHELLFEPTLDLTLDETAFTALAAVLGYYVTGQYALAEGELEIMIDRATDPDPDLIWLRGNLAARQEQWALADGAYADALAAAADARTQALLTANTGLVRVASVMGKVDICPTEPIDLYTQAIALAEDARLDDLLPGLYTGRAYARYACPDNEIPGFEGMLDVIEPDLLRGTAAVPPLPFAHSLRALVYTNGFEDAVAFEEACTALRGAIPQPLAHAVLWRILIQYAPGQEDAPAEMHRRAYLDSAHFALHRDAITDGLLAEREQGTLMQGERGVLPSALAACSQG